MDVKVCKNCRRLFNYIYGPELCPDCAKLLSDSRDESKRSDINPALKLVLAEDEAKFEQIKDYIMTHPKATVAEIAEFYEIAPAKLFEWIRGDRLEFSEESSDAWFKCERCGTRIKSGRLCNRCKAN